MNNNTNIDVKKNDVVSKGADIIANGDGLKITGALVYSSASEISEKSKLLLESQVQTDKQIINIDCSDVTRIDSAGIALFVGWKRICSNNRKQFSMINLPEQAASLIDTYRLEKILESKLV